MPSLNGTSAWPVRIAVVALDPRQFGVGPKTVAARSLDLSSRSIIASRGKRYSLFEDSIRFSIPIAFTTVTTGDLSIASLLKSHPLGYWEMGPHFLRAQGWKAE